MVSTPMRAAIAALLWTSAAVVAFFEARSVFIDPCARHSDRVAALALIAVAVLATVASFYSLPKVFDNRRALVAALLSAVIGAGTALLLGLILLSAWLGNCAN